MEVMHGSLTEIGGGIMSQVKSFFLALGKFSLGFIGWIFVSSLFNIAVAITFGSIGSSFGFYIILIANQLAGVGLAVLAFRREKRWIGRGILTGVGLFLLGAIFPHSPCMPGLFLPFPLTLGGWC